MNFRTLKRTNNNFSAGSFSFRIINICYTSVQSISAPETTSSAVRLLLGCPLAKISSEEGQLDLLQVCSSYVSMIIRIYKTQSIEQTNTKSKCNLEINFGTDIGSAINFETLNWNRKKMKLDRKEENLQWQSMHKALLLQKK